MYLWCQGLSNDQNFYYNSSTFGNFEDQKNILFQEIFIKILSIKAKLQNYPKEIQLVEYNAATKNEQENYVNSLNRDQNYAYNTALSLLFLKTTKRKFTKMLTTEIMGDTDMTDLKNSFFMLFQNISTEYIKTNILKYIRNI